MTLRQNKYLDHPSVIDSMGLFLVQFWLLDMSILDGWCKEKHHKLNLHQEK